MKKIGVIHSGHGTVEPIKKLLGEVIPDAVVMNIVDDSLAGRVLSAGSAGPDVVQAVVLYALSAQAAGCDALYNPCALIRGAAEVAQRAVKIPYLCNDVPMVRTAIQMCRRIALITANEPAMANVSAMAEREIREQGRGNILNRYLCLDAFHALTKEKNKEKYTELMKQAVAKAASENDVVLLGQGSMYAADYPDLPVPVLDVHRSGAGGLRQLLAEP